MKLNAKIRDYRKLINPENLVGVVFYVEKFLQKGNLESFSLEQKLGFLANCLIHNIDKYCPLITKIVKSKQECCTKVICNPIQRRKRLRRIYP